MNELEVLYSIVAQVEGNEMVEASVIAMLAWLTLEIVNRGMADSHSLLKLLGTYHVPNQLNFTVATN